MTKVIHSSHLALRFYKGCWSREELEPYLLRGQLIDQIQGQEARDYYWLDHTQQSALDVERLYRELEPRVFTWRHCDGNDEELIGDAAIEYLKRMNW